MFYKLLFFTQQYISDIVPHQYVQMYCILVAKCTVKTQNFNARRQLRASSQSLPHNRQILQGSRSTSRSTGKTPDTPYLRPLQQVSPAPCHHLCFPKRLEPQKRIKVKGKKKKKRTTVKASHTAGKKQEGD